MSVSTEKADGTTEKIELGDINKCDKKQFESLKKSFKKKGDPKEKRRFVFSMNTQEAECVTAVKDSKGNDINVGDKITFTYQHGKFLPSLKTFI